MQNDNPFAGEGYLFQVLNQFQSLCLFLTTFLLLAHPSPSKLGKIQFPSCLNLSPAFALALLCLHLLLPAVRFLLVKYFVSCQVVMDKTPMAASWLLMNRVVRFHQVPRSSRLQSISQRWFPHLEETPALGPQAPALD